jgi:hypothetical protein
MSNNQFKLQINLTKSYVGDDGGHYLEGVASGPEVDLTGERMSPEALQSMVASIQKRLVEFRDAHKEEWNDDLGEVVSLELDENNHLIYRSKLDMNLSGAKSARQKAQGSRLVVGRVGHRKASRARRISSWTVTMAAASQK